jgi:dihydropteroate synthase
MKPRPQFELEISGRKVLLGERTTVMGVLNVTPDSFSDGGRYLDPKRAVEHALELVREGADWIDVGGESTRPGSKPVTAAEELRRVLPVIRGLRRRLRAAPISIDTTKAEVAEEALRAGAAMINDVSGLRFDPRLADIARRYRAPLILMHLRGRPETMQQGPFARSVWRSISAGLSWSIRKAAAVGVRRSQLIIDPGLGFGKTRRQNFEVLAELGRLRRFRLPILAGTSRKSFVQAIVAGEGLKPSRRPRLRSAAYWALTSEGGRRAGKQSPPLPLLLGDAAAVAASIVAGAHIVRVHDVGAVMPAVRIADAILAAGQHSTTATSRLSHGG